MNGKYVGYHDDCSFVDLKATNMDDGRISVTWFEYKDNLIGSIFGISILIIGVSILIGVGAATKNILAGLVAIILFFVLFKLAHNKTPESIKDKLSFILYGYKQYQQRVIFGEKETIIIEHKIPNEQISRFETGLYSELYKITNKPKDDPRIIRVWLEDDVNIFISQNEYGLDVNHSIRNMLARTFEHFQRKPYKNGDTGDNNTDFGVPDY